MKSTKKIFRIFLIIMLTTVSNSYAQDAQREFYQLKIYSFDNAEQIKATDTYLENAYLPALKEIGISSIGVFKERDSVISKTYVLIPFNSMDDFLSLNSKLDANALHTTKGSAYLQAPHDKPTYQRIESILLKAFIDMPKMAEPNLDGPREDRVYEMRSYESATEKLHVNKVDMFNAGGEVPLFDDLGFNAVFYGSVISGPNMPNLMYMTTHKNKEAQTANWKSFVDSPVWAKLKVRPEYQNNVSKNTKYMLYPTEYSDY
ncbi:NIPSNAP family protein [Aurantibacter crassamenti]|uniref:NIPSNAP family protein n=1 Tax=Aurantibacter crassamenti TaxID=1837375 RepID=UPI00193A7363|nr:NIPSNAP family protein [Aurantibacter crassamenti]MBM1106227.1 NIPSNAP family protein [Aurantibacter crassamenti]